MDLDQDRAELDLADGAAHGSEDGLLFTAETVGGLLRLCLVIATLLQECYPLSS